MELFNEPLVMQCSGCGRQMQSGSSSGIGEVKPKCSACRKTYIITDHDVDTSRVKDSTVKVYYVQKA